MLVRYISNHKYEEGNSQVSTQSIESLQRFGLVTRRVSDTKGGEYHGPCPLCGGKDRFTVRPNDPGSQNGFFICRKCNIAGDLNKLAGILRPGAKITNSEKKFHERYAKKNISTPWVAARKNPPSNSWQQAMSRVVSIYTGQTSSAKSLLYSYFRPRNIDEKTIECSKLFYVPKKRYESVVGFDSSIQINEGICIPNYRGDILYSIHIRQMAGDPKYIYVKGSIAVPYHITKVDKIGAPVFIVESELDAILLYQAAGDLVHAVALASVSARPDAYTDALITNASHVFVCLDYDDAGLNELSWWRSHYPQAKHIFATCGKDIGDMHFSSKRLRDWVVTLIERSERKELIVSRTSPNFQTYLLEPSQVTQQIEHLKSAEQVAITVETLPYAGRSKDVGMEKPVVMALGTGDSVFVINLEEVPVQSLSGLADCKLITYDFLKHISVLNIMGLDIKNMECVALMHSIYLQGNVESLFDLACLRTGYDILNIRDAVGDNANFEKCVISAALSAYLIGKIYDEQRPYISRPGNSNKLKYYQLMRDAVPAISQINIYGLPFDWEAHEGLVSTWKEALASQNPHTGLSAEQLKSRLSTWGDAFMGHRSVRTDRVHPQFKFNGTVTGRITCSHPNLQGMPKDHGLRSLVRPPKGYVLVGADYSQIDVRVAAMLSGDEAMNQIFASGADYHTMTAATLFGVSEDAVTGEQRDAAKQATYAAMYGGASDLMSNMGTAFPQFFRWREAQKRPSAFLFTPSGRYIPRDFSKNWGNSQINYPIQATSADIMLAALGNLVVNLEELDAVIVHCVHDEILVDVAECDASLAVQALESAMEKGFVDVLPGAPTKGLVKANIGYSWADLK